MPAQQGLRTDEKRLPAGPAQKPAGRGKKDPICLLKTRTGDLATKNRQLVSKHHDLKLLELTRPRTQRRHRERPPKQQVHQRHNHEQTPSTRTDDKPTLRPRNQPTPTSPRATGWIYAPHALPLWRDRRQTRPPRPRERRPHPRATDREGPHLQPLLRPERVHRPTVRCFHPAQLPARGVKLKKRTATRIAGAVLRT